MVRVVTSLLAKPSSQFSGQRRSLVWKRFHTLKNLTPGLQSSNGAAAFKMYQWCDRVVCRCSAPVGFSFILWLRPARATRSQLCAPDMLHDLAAVLNLRG